MTDRRTFIKTVGGGVLLISPLGAAACKAARGANAALEAEGWDRVPQILARINAPVFPDRDFEITEYGATEGGTIDCTQALRDAIAACSAAGGGRVIVPEGRFLTGAIHLANNVNLHVSRGATLAFSQKTTDYLPIVFTRFEGVECMNYSPFIYAFEKENVAITGDGTLDGQADEEHWWPWKGRTSVPGQPDYGASRQKLLAMAEQGVPLAKRVFGEDEYLRPNFIQPYRCKNVLIEGVTILNSPMWEIHPVLCTNVTVRNVKISTLGPNNDGCNPESCRDVLIEGCVFNTGDDCIAIKSGRNADGRRLNVPSEDIIVRNCDMRDGHGGVTIGSEISGHCRNVFVHDCKMDSPRLDRALRFKNNAMRGGVLEHVYMRDCAVGEVAESVLSIDFYYEEGQQGDFTPVARNIELRNVTSRKSPYALYLRGFQKAPIENIRVVDCKFSNVGKGNRVEFVRGLVFERSTINDAPARVQSTSTQGASVDSPDLVVGDAGTRGVR